MESPVTPMFCVLATYTSLCTATATLYSGGRQEQEAAVLTETVQNRPLSFRAIKEIIGLKYLACFLPRFHMEFKGERFWTITKTTGD